MIKKKNIIEKEGNRYKTKMTGASLTAPKSSKYGVPKMANEIFLGTPYLPWVLGYVIHLPYLS